MKKLLIGLLLCSAITSNAFARGNSCKFKIVNNETLAENFNDSAKSITKRDAALATGAAFFFLTPTLGGILPLAGLGLLIKAGVVKLSKEYKIGEIERLNAILEDAQAYMDGSDPKELKELKYFTSRVYGPFSRKKSMKRVAEVITEGSSDGLCLPSLRPISLRYYVTAKL